jgi:hypothetical protein
MVVAIVLIVSDVTETFIYNIVDLKYDEKNLSCFFTFVDSGISDISRQILERGPK